MAPTIKRLTPTFPYRKNGTRTQRNPMSTHLASINRIESNGRTMRQKIKSATHKLKTVIIKNQKSGTICGSKKKKEENTIEIFMVRALKHILEET